MERLVGLGEPTMTPKENWVLVGLIVMLIALIGFNAYGFHLEAEQRAQQEAAND